MTSARRIYLDHNASSPLRPEARAAALAALDEAGNPSSVHAEGRRARAIVETAREQIAAAIGARPADVVFTSGATEANAAALGVGWRTICVAHVEHDSVLAPARASGARLVETRIGPDGVADVGSVAAPLLRAPVSEGPSLVTLQLANNETGVIQPVAEVARCARTHGASSHCDAVQALGRMPIDVGALGVDYLSVSSHKIGGPKGVGALFVRAGAPWSPLIHGGGQERRRRAGTENVAAIAGFGAAVAAIRAGAAEMERVSRLRSRLEAGLLAISPDAVIIGGLAPRLGNTTSVAMAGEKAETLVIKLDLAGVAVSAGAACSSGKVGASRVLGAMQLDPALARSAIRISLGWSTTEADVDGMLAAWREIADPIARRRAA